MSSGSYKGIVYVGIIKKLLKYNLLDLSKIESIYGSSVGALCGFLIGLKLDWNIICDHIINIPGMSVFKFKTEMLTELLTSKGLYGKEVFYKYVHGYLKEAGLKKNITIKEFYDYNNIDLHIFALQLNEFKSVDFNHKTHPNLSLIDAIYMSCSIPIIFKPEYYNGSYYIDGCVLSDFPIKECLDDKDPSEYKNILGIASKGWSPSGIKKEDTIFKVFEQMIFGFLYQTTKKCWEELDIHSDIYIIPLTLPHINGDSISRMFSSPENRLEFINYGYKLVDDFIETNNLNKNIKLVSDENNEKSNEELNEEQK